MNRADRRNAVDVRVAPNRRRGGGTAPARDRRRPILYATLVVLAIAAIAAVAFASRVPKSASEAPEMSTLKVGDTAPAFAAATTAGPFDSTKTGGKPVVLEVFATWCPHCQRETKVIDQLYQQFGQRVAFVAVSGSANGIDGSSPESQADVVNFAQEFNVRYPIAFDPSLDVAHKYLQGGFPTLVVINRDQKITYINSGEQSAADLKAAIEKALKS